MAALRLLALFCLLAAAPAWADEAPALPALAGRVTDLSGTLSAGQRQQLDDALAAIEAEKGSQVAILLLPTTQPEAIEQFGIRLAEAWKLGRKGVDDGVIVIVAKNDRKTRIEVGYGLEGAIPDAIAKRIIAERMAPRFRENDFFGGLMAATAAIGGAIRGEQLPPPPAGGANGGGSNVDPMSALFAVMVGGMVMRGIFGFFGTVLAAGIGAALAYFLVGSWIAAVAAAIILLAVLNMLGNGMRGGSGGPFSGGGFSGGGFSGGGFSGSGGGFGGGGASGSW
jgi:uncharacterized protein